MKKMIAYLLLSLSASLAWAQPKEVMDLAAMLDSTRVEVTYYYENAGKIPLGNGSAVLQGRKYKVFEGNSSYYCDGKALWSVMPDIKEVYIEKAGSDSDLFGNISSVLKEVKDFSRNGNELKFSVLLPGNDERIYCKVRINRESPFDTAENFSYDTGGLGSNWIITDLR